MGEAGAAGPRFWGRSHLFLLSPSPAVQTQGSSLQEQDLALCWGLLCPGAASCTAPEQPQHQRGSAEGFWAVLLQGSAVSIAPTSPGEKLRCKPVPTRL